MSSTSRLYDQAEKDGKLIVGVASDESTPKPYSASSDQTIKRAAKIPLDVKLTQPVRFEAGDNLQVPKVDGAELVKQLRQVIQLHIGTPNEADELTVVCFFLGTYCFQLFRSFPDLWLFVPDVQVHEQVRRLVERLSFNCFLAESIGSVDACYKLIEDFTPTLLLEDPRRAAGKRFSSLTAQQNKKDRIKITWRLDHQVGSRIERLIRVRLYCPRVTVSRKVPPVIQQPHTLSIPVFGSYVVPAVREEDFEVIRGRMMAFVLNHAGEIQQESLSVRTSMAESDLRLPLMALAKTLLRFDCITTAELASFQELLDRSSRPTGRDLENDEDDMILLFLSGFIPDGKAKGVEFHKLEDLVKEMQKMGIGPFLTSWKLSRFLNQRKLVLDETRPRIDNIDGKRKLQRAAVKIDIAELRRLTPFSAW